MKRLTIPVFACCIIFFVSGCSSQKKTTATVVEENPRPGWVRQKPTENMYYHGVGFAYKVPGRDDHHQIARNNALNDLSGEISIEISNQSLLYQVESDQRVRETYKSTIMSSSNARLEGYELVSVWENEREIWNYYRLSKSEYERIQREKRRKAIEMSVAQFKTAERETDPYRQFTGIISALDAVKEYLGEPLVTDEIDGNSAFLANYLMNRLRTLVDGWELKPSAHVQPVKRGQAIRIPSSFWDGTTVYFTLMSERRPLVNVPFVLSYSGQRNHRQNATTDRNGHVYFVWEKVSSLRAQEQLHARVDLQAMARESTKDPLIQALIDKLREPTASLTLEILPPKVYIESRELLMNEVSSPAILANVFTNEFRKDGMVVVNDIAEADYVLDIKAQTRVGNGAGEATQFVTAYLDATIQLYGMPGRQVMFSTQMNGVRGVQLNDEKAARESYQRAVRDIEREVYPDMRRKVF
jgi:hypothetical protein